jgi:predicted Zn-dependent protease with MMP-like domain
MTDALFDSMAADVWTRLQPLIPDDLKEHFGKIQFVIENEITPDQLLDLGYPATTDPLEICGLHVGVPLTEASVIHPPIFPARVYIFRMALLDLTDYDGSPEAVEDLREEIAVTLLHEVGHFFGLEEEDLERLGFE